MIARASSIESARVESPRPLTRARLSAAGPLGTLLNEHRVILLTTDLLQSWALRVEHDQEVVRRELRVLSRFLTTYIDEIHQKPQHPSRRRGGGAAPPPHAALSELEHEHDQERYLMAVFGQLSREIGAWSDHARLHFASIAHEFVALQRRHVQTESEIVYPLVESSLDAARQARLWSELQRFDCEAKVRRLQSRRLLQALCPPSMKTGALLVPVERLLERVAPAVSPRMRGNEALRIAMDHGTHYLPVTLDGAAVGLVCTCDLKGDRLERSVAALIEDRSVTIPSHATSLEALQLMTRKRVGALLVSTGEGQYGVITSADLERADLPAPERRPESPRARLANGSAF